MSLEPESGGGGLTEYIVHHLTHNTKQFSFGQVHMDSWIVALVLGLLGCFLLWTQARKATSGVPCKLQAFVEMLVEFVDRHGQARPSTAACRLIAPLALTIFCLVF